LTGEVALDEQLDGPDQVPALLLGGAEDTHHHGGGRAGIV
jgi:hypothetical protein